MSPACVLGLSCPAAEAYGVPAGPAGLVAVAVWFSPPGRSCPCLALCPESFVSMLLPHFTLSCLGPPLRVGEHAMGCGWCACQAVGTGWGWCHALLHL